MCSSFIHSSLIVFIPFSALINFNNHLLLNYQNNDPSRCNRSFSLLAVHGILLSSKIAINMESFTRRLVSPLKGMKFFNKKSKFFLKFFHSIMQHSRKYIKTFPFNDFLPQRNVLRNIEKTNIPLFARC